MLALAFLLTILPFFAEAVGSFPGTRRHSSRRAHQLARRSSSYQLVDKFAGESFFDGWSYWNAPDPTNGQVNYLSQGDATAANLTYVGSDGAAVIAVDDYTWLGAGQPRNSVRITSNKVYNQGLFIMDLNKMPHGCSVWPAWWTVGPNWPSGGEIDIVEGVHEQATNQMTLHTAEGCTLDSSPSGDIAAFTSEVLGTQCASSNSDNDGCAFSDDSSTSYGHGLNTIGGGVFAMLWDDDGVKIWHFQRANVPSDISSFAPNPSSWGSPAAFWSSSTCSPGQFFNNHQMVIDTTLCGDWAGASYSSAGCPATCSDHIQDPTNFQLAKWSINYIATYNSN